MLQRLFPQENSSLQSLAQISAQVAGAAALLSEMVGTPTSDYPDLFERMLAHEASCTELFFYDPHLCAQLVRHPFTA